MTLYFSPNGREATPKNQYQRSFPLAGAINLFYFRSGNTTLKQINR
jgi:hypothetical protein